MSRRAASNIPDEWRGNIADNILPQQKDETTHEWYERVIAAEIARSRKVDEFYRSKDRRRVKTADVAEPIDWQRANGQLAKEDVVGWERNVKGGFSAYRSRAFRRSSERWFGRLNAIHQQAVDRIRAAFEAAVGPVRPRVAALEGAGRKGVFARCEAERRLTMADRYWRWSRMADEVTILVLCHGVSVREAQVIAQRRQSSAEEIIQGDLDRWTTLFG